jgi:pimeloyl-ACP methyl ester carboxylesterase
MTEKAVLFGETKSLVGILTEAETAAPNASPAAIFFNVGLIHRVGPNRLYVRLARKLAALGFPALRFDLAGIGDSPPRSGGSSFEENVLKDVAAAMDFLAARGARRYILIGLCSGADHALRVAGRDERVAGLALIDPYAAPTSGFFLHRYLPRLFNVQSWRRFVTGKSLLWRYWQRARRPRPGAKAAEQAARRNEVVRPLDALARRGADLFFIYSGAGSPYYNYRTELKPRLDALDFHGRLGVHILKEADHTFTLLESQAELIDAIADWAVAARARRRTDGAG